MILFILRSKKQNDTKKLIYKTETDTDLEKEFMVMVVGRVGGRITLGV